VVIEAVFVSSGTTGDQHKEFYLVKIQNKGLKRLLEEIEILKVVQIRVLEKEYKQGTNVGTTVDPEKQRQRDIRNKEFCDTLRQIKQYLNNTKEADLTVNCKKTQKTINQIMMALTGGTPVTPVVGPEVNTQPIPVTDKVF
jgi:hypothetical protein